ncbi:Alanine racemase [Trichinella pseudospiralis]
MRGWAVGMRGNQLNDKCNNSKAAIGENCDGESELNDDVQRKSNANYINWPQLTADRRRPCGTFLAGLAGIGVRFSDAYLREENRNVDCPQVTHSSDNRMLPVPVAQGRFGAFELCHSCRMSNLAKVK